MEERTTTDGLSDAVWDFTALLQSLHLASSDSTDAQSVQNSFAPANLYSTEAVQHRVDALLTQNNQARDLNLSLSNGLEWHIPMDAAIARSTVLASKLRNAKRPASLEFSSDAISALVMDSMVHHWLFGEYDFQQINVSDGNIKVQLFHVSNVGYSSPATVFLIPESEGMVGAHLRVYDVAKSLDDETLATTALDNFLTALHRIEDAKVFVGLFKRTFKTDNAGSFIYTGGSFIESSILAHACLWHKVWVGQGCEEYITLTKDVSWSGKVMEWYVREGGKQFEW